MTAARQARQCSKGLGETHLKREIFFLFEIKSLVKVRQRLKSSTFVFWSSKPLQQFERSQTRPKYSEMYEEGIVCMSMTQLLLITEGWLEIDKHYSLELCFSIEKQPETVWRGGNFSHTTGWGTVVLVSPPEANFPVMQSSGQGQEGHSTTDQTRVDNTTFFILIKSCIRDRIQDTTYLEGIPANLVNGYPVPE